MTRFLIHEHWGGRPERHAKVYLVQDFEDNYEVEFYENKSQLGVGYVCIEDVLPPEEKDNG